MLKTVTPNPRTWTLRFKNARTTIIVEVDPLQPLSDVRAELLKAIQQTHPDGKLNGHEIPQNPDEIKLGRPVNINMLSEGYVSLETEVADEEPTGKGKGKASAVKPKSTSLKSCPQEAGLRDGGLVAFKFKSEDDVEEVEADDFTVVQEKWNVIIPTMEETYGDDDAEERDMDETSG